MKTRTLLMAAGLALFALLAVAANPARAAGPDDTTLPRPTQSISYTVQSGDSWVNISKKYGVSASRLIDVNGLRTRPDLLFVGEKIIIPIDLGTTPSFVSPYFYTVQAGDTVANLVTKLYIDKTALLSANGLSKNAALTAGQKLLIPAGPHRYVVQAGDTIQSIAAMFSTTANNLLKYNTHLGNGGAIFPGNNVYVPIQYDATFVAASIEGVGGGGEGTTGGSATTVTLNSTTGLSATVSNPSDVSRAANASVISTSEFITMPANVVNLGQPLQIRWFRVNSVRRDASRENGAIATIVMVFRGGNGSYTVRHFQGSAIVGIAIRGIYVNYENNDLWNEIETEIQTTCSSNAADTLLFSSGATTLQARYEFKNLQCP